MYLVMLNLTKGDWHIIERGSRYEVSTDYTDVVALKNGIKNFDDAVVIAAAPEMYELLKLVAKAENYQLSDLVLFAQSQLNEIHKWK